MTLGAGNNTVFAGTGRTGVSTIQLGSGPATIGLGGQSVSMILAAGASPRTIALFDFRPVTSRTARSSR